jgi:hypothetical protein
MEENFEGKKLPKGEEILKKLEFKTTLENIEKKIENYNFLIYKIKIKDEESLIFIKEIKLKKFINYMKIKKYLKKLNKTKIKINGE